MQQIGSTIKTARLKNKLSQRQLSELSGVRIASISEIENGLGNSTITTLLKLATALRCTIKINPHDNNL